MLHLLPFSIEIKLSILSILGKTTLTHFVAFSARKCSQCTFDWLQCIRSHILSINYIYSIVIQDIIKGPYKPNKSFHLKTTILILFRKLQGIKPFQIMFQCWHNKEYSRMCGQMGCNTIIFTVLMQMSELYIDTNDFWLPLNGIRSLSLNKSSVTRNKINCKWNVREGFCIERIM